MAVFPDALWDKNAQNTGNDAAGDATVANAADYNEMANEVAEIETWLRDGVIRACVNNTGDPILAGELVYITGHSATDDLPEIAWAQADAAATLAEFVVCEDIAVSAEGNMARRFVVRGLNTSGRAEGDPVYLDAGTPGLWTHIAPLGANYGQFVGRITEVHASTGEIEFYIDRPPIPDKTGLEYASDGVLIIKDDGVRTAKILNANVTAPKLSNAVADLIPQLAAITSGAEASDVIAFTIQAQDVQGNNLSTFCVMNVWHSAALFGAPAAADGMTFTTGTVLHTPVADAISVVLTDSLGKIIVDVTNIGGKTRYVMASFEAYVLGLEEDWT